LRVEQLGPSGRDEHHGRIANVLRQVLEERKLAALRPVNVLEHEHCRLGKSGGFDEASGSEEEEQDLCDTVVGSKPEQQ